MAPSSHSFTTSWHVVWGQNAMAAPSVTPESFTARRRSSVRSTNARRPAAVSSMVVVAAFNAVLLSYLELLSGPPSADRFDQGDCSSLLPSGRGRAPASGGL